MTIHSSRLPKRIAADAAPSSRFAEDVDYYLSLQPRQLPSRYLYDALGSALFDAICQLPWYQITQAEHALLEEYGPEVFATVGDISSIVELGGGNGEKLATLIEGGRGSAGRVRKAADRTAGRIGPLLVHLIDVSASALALSARAVGVLENVQVVTHQATYEDGLVEVAAARPPQPHRVLTLFLGSNIGNFDPPAAEAFLTAVRASMETGDSFLLGADLVKSERELLLAYDDPLGVTAAFNRNLLVRINRELRADFDVEGFAHRAVWNRAASRVEMHLVSRRAQRVRVGSLDLRFSEGETIWTESSYKYSAAGILDLVERCGFRRLRQWIEPRAAFSLTLVEAV